MKKLMSLVLTAAMMMSLAACGGSTGGTTTTDTTNEKTNAPAETEATSNEKTNTSTETEPTSTSDKIKIGVVQITEHPSLDTIRESFLEAMKELGYDESKVEYDIKNAQGEQTNLSTITQKFVGDKSDLIVAIATPTAQAAAAATTDIPVLFSAVTDPVAAELVEDPTKPSGNITGTSDAIPVDQVLELCQKLTPDVKKIGFLYTSSEINSQVTVEKAIEVAETMGYECKTVTISETSELQQAAASLANDVDAIYTPIDNTIAASMQVLANVGTEQKIPVYVGADSMVIDGGFATVGIDYTLLGEKTAQMAKEILEGKPVSEVPVATLDNFDTIINQDVAEAIGIEIPAEVRSEAMIIKDGAMIAE